jgi:Domain of unknown function (DUF4124)
MKALGFLVVIGLSLAAAPSAALADGRHGHVRGDFHGSRRFDGRHHGFNHHGFNRFPVFVSPSVVVVPPVYAAPYVAPAPVYAAPPPVYAPAPAYAAPAPPPVPRVVEFPTGRYELRGDGVYSPYSWVWIPNPPVAPPPPPAPTAPPAPLAPPTSVPDPGPRRVPAQTALYRWTDERGVTTWTDSLEKVPVRYRENARALTP